MDLILATSSGEEECVLEYDFDIDLGSTYDFEISLTYGTWDSRLKIGKRVYIPGTEYGGIIKDILSATNTGEIKLRGYTWRGYLWKRIIIPEAGQNYKVVSGDLNAILRSIVSIPGFQVSGEAAGASVSSYQFNRYIDMATGLERMCESVGYRLDLKYVQTETSGYVLVQAVKANNYGDNVEYSQDSLIDFSSEDNQMGVNHLICLGKGELKDRIVVHLYADAKGNISQTQTITGINEIVETYDNPGAEQQTLIEGGRTRLKDLLSKKTFIPDMKDVNAEFYMGDIISGRDYITGNSMTKPITNKIVSRETGVMAYMYKIEGEE